MKNSEPSVHAIKLRGPYQGTVKRSKDQTIAAGTKFRLKVPSDWSQQLGSGFQGEVQLTRAFQKPTNLATDQKVWIAIEDNIQGMEVWLNGEQIASPGHKDEPSHRIIRHQIQQHLQKSNELCLIIFHNHDQFEGGLSGEVRLEIED